ncbi:MAG TPA: VOC family protein [Flavobacteriales bacterium]|nr:VOC family protein [Flavobacteriales bacterium]HRO39113.1 VOC family protein [Flavobacteriales bacterium]HRP81533.1 VOC family protein [Flavobacteriales bacterium]HRQ83708.1 VOC family protein [Flavobacteriales bacterium]
MKPTEVQFILYVADQARSTAFYRHLLGMAPALEVPGMTEFQLGPGVKLGLMPEQGIARIISGPLPHPAQGQGVPRCELYVLVDDLALVAQRAREAGALEVDPASDRDWEHRVVYFADPDAHVVALACPMAHR